MKLKDNLIQTRLAGKHYFGGGGIRATSAREVDPVFLDTGLGGNTRPRRTLLTALVVYNSGDMQPGPGFFDLAGRLGKNTNDILRCWIKELKRVHASLLLGQGPVSVGPQKRGATCLVVVG